MGNSVTSKQFSGAHVRRSTVKTTVICAFSEMGSEDEARREGRA